MTPKLWIRIEGILGLLLCTIIYYFLGFNLFVFLACLLLPDLFMLGYLANKKTGAFLYNLGHVFIFPLALILFTLITSKQIFLGIGLIWGSHIFLDRMVGYGLKYNDGFKITHLQKLE